MAQMIRDLSVDQFRQLVQESLKGALRELLEDPDAGYELRPAFARRLRQSLESLERGDEGIELDQMIERLDLKQ